jgi:hypothetical protein
MIEALAEIVLEFFVELILELLSACLAQVESIRKLFS